MGNGFVPVANAEQRTYWNEHAPEAWVTHQEAMDEQLRAHGALALEALELRAGEHVLDLGCGCGDTTLALAAEIGPSGRVMGVDLSAPMLTRARERVAEGSLTYVELEEADAQTHSFPEGAFDAAYSRFGVMFFEDPVAAFRNVARALKPSGRLSFVCWQPASRNPWVTVPLEAVFPFVPPPSMLDPNLPGPFSLADPARVSKVLADAGFDDVKVEPAAVQMDFGPIEQTTEFLMTLGPTARALREAQPSEQTLDAIRIALRDAVTAFATGDRVTLGSSVWVVTAKRGP